MRCLCVVQRGLRGAERIERKKKVGEEGDWSQRDSNSQLAAQGKRIVSLGVDVIIRTYFDRLVTREYHVKHYKHSNR